MMRLKYITLVVYSVSLCFMSCSHPKIYSGSWFNKNSKNHEVALIFGPPASGKGYISGLMQDRFGYKHISTGDILRFNNSSDKNGSTDLKEKINDSMLSGKMVNDEVIMSLLRQYLIHNNSEKIILDGFPRNKYQLKSAESFLDILGFKINSIILINCQKDKLLSGLKIRQESSLKSGAPQRSDDNRDIFLQRLKLYEEFFSGEDGLEKFIKNLNIKNNLIKVVEIKCHSSGISDILDLRYQNRKI